MSMSTKVRRFEEPDVSIHLPGAEDDARSER